MIGRNIFETPGFTGSWFEAAHSKVDRHGRDILANSEVWLAQCLCEANESLPYRKLVESAKAEEQRIWIGRSQGESINGENLNALGGSQLFRLS